MVGGELVSIVDLAPSLSSGWGSQRTALALREFDFATMGVGKSFVVYSCRFYLAWTQLPRLFTYALAISLYAQQIAIPK